MESAYTNAEGRDGDVDFLESYTSVQRLVTDGIESVRQVDPIETATSLKSLLCQRIDAGRDNDLTQRGTSGECLFSEMSSIRRR